MNIYLIITLAIFSILIIVFLVNYFFKTNETLLFYSKRQHIFNKLMSLEYNRIDIEYDLSILKKLAHNDKLKNIYNNLDYLFEQFEKIDVVFKVNKSKPNMLID